jgi:hypothetical protein
MELTQEYLKQIIFYSPETGQMFWREARGSVVAGAEITARNADGYVVAQIDRKRHGVARLAWLYMTGELPVLEVDHKNNVRDDNRFSNLQLATHLENSQFRKTSGLPNPLGKVGIGKHGNKFRADIRVQGKRIYLGLFPTAEEAAAAHAAAKMKYHANRKEDT